MDCNEIQRFIQEELHPKTARSLDALATDGIFAEEETIYTIHQPFVCWECKVPFRSKFPLANGCFDHIQLRLEQITESRR